jgi:hypothetical protein
MSEPIHDRKNTHGNWRDQFRCAQDLKRVIRAWADKRPDFPPEVLEELEMQALKQSRVLVGDFWFADHHEDIAGYALRVVGK